MPHVNDMTREELVQAVARLQAERDGLVRMMAGKYEYIEKMEEFIKEVADFGMEKDGFKKADAMVRMMEDD